MAIPEYQQRSNSVNQLLVELLQLVGEILLIRQPRVQTATAPAPPPPPPMSNFNRFLTNDRCPFCPGGVRSRKGSGLVH